MDSFDEILHKIQNIHELFLSRIRCDKEDSCDSMEFSKHLFETKCWFARVSWIHKKEFLLQLINGINNISCISLMLKSIWNCRPKDAIMSISELKIWSSYDQVPLDHDRTVALSSLQDIMMDDRNWLLALEPGKQCLVLAELLSIAGGPIMWEVLKTLEKIYDKHKELEMKEWKECNVIIEPPPDKKAAAVENKKDQTPRRKSSAQNLSVAKLPFDSAQAQRELELNLGTWTSAIKSLKDNAKLEEIEIAYKDGSKRRIWRANRPKTDSLDTVDIIQLLPSAISKHILFYLPSQQLNECARVNKYWAYLVDEFRAELIARQKIDIELDRLRENIYRHDIHLSLLKKPESLKNLHVNSATSRTNKVCDSIAKSCALNLRMEARFTKKPRIAKLHFRNMADLNERLDRRGAADKNLWKWCKNISKNVSEDGLKTRVDERWPETENTKFPRHIIQSVKIPLSMNSQQK